MPKKYDVYDERGRKIGEAEEQPSASDQIVGAAIFFYLLWKALPGLLIIGFIALIIATGAWLWQAGSNVINYGTLDSKAIQAIESQRQAATREAEQAEFANRTAMAITQLKQMQRININQRIDVWAHGHGYFIVEFVQFEENRFLVYLDLDVEGGGHYERSCIRYGGPYDYDKVIEPDENRFAKLSETHFKGFQVYNYSKLRPDTEYRFTPACDVTDSIQIPIFRTTW
ncbi:MAG: hypothetical protein WBW48_03715 [Anaerolineae bacterium]